MNLPLRIRRRLGRLWWTWPVDASVAIAVVVCFLLVPPADHWTLDTSSYFGAVAQVSATLLVAVALLAGTLDGEVEYHVRRWISVRTFAYLGVGAMVGLVGSVDGIGSAGQRWLLIVSAGSGVGGLATVLIMGHENIAQRRARGFAARARALDSGGLDGIDERPRSGAGDPPLID